MVFRLSPHHQRFNRRLTKSPKLYFVDTGLLCYLLQIRSADELATHALRGAVFENLVIADLTRRCLHAGVEPRIAFWRDHRGNEIDLVLNRADGAIPVEIKSGTTVASDLFKGLRYWRAAPRRVGVRRRRKLSAPRHRGAVVAALVVSAERSASLARRAHLL